MIQFIVGAAVLQLVVGVCLWQAARVKHNHMSPVTGAKMIQYVNIMNRCGLESAQAKAFLAKHDDDIDFQTRAVALRILITKLGKQT